VSTDAFSRIDIQAGAPLGLPATQLSATRR
jgi:hypothetical protein